jgi:hypothetical protein
MPRTRPWEVSDELWERVQPLIPPTPSHAKGGRPRFLEIDRSSDLVAPELSLDKLTLSVYLTYGVNVTG